MITYPLDTELAEVPVNAHALTDDTDFKSREVSVAYNAAGMDLVWCFITAAGAYSETAVTPSNSGNYLWGNQGKGFYSIQIPASGGASINNNTAGWGKFAGIATGILHWSSEWMQFGQPVANSANVTQWNGTNVATPTTAGVPEVDVTHVGGANTVDGIAIVTMFKRFIAFTGGKTTRVDNGDGTLTISLYDQSDAFLYSFIVDDTDGDRS